MVKFYSRQCRACLRIAAKYRRLALEKRDEIDCYEVESLASRSLVDGLNVTKVPSVQIYDPDGVTRLADGPCMPDDFPRCVPWVVSVSILSLWKTSGPSRRVTRRWRHHETAPPRRRRRDATSDRFDRNAPRRKRPRTGPTR